MRKRLDIDEAVGMWAAGASQRAIAGAFDVALSTVKAAMKRHRARFPTKVQEQTSAREAKFAKGLEALAEGASRDDAAAAAGVNAHTFKMWISKDRDRARAAERRGAARRNAQPAPVAAEVTVASAPAVAASSVAPQSAPPAEDEDGEALDFVPTKAGAFRPLPGRVPCELMDAGAKTCRWPIQLAGDPLRVPTVFVCDAPRAPEKTRYCPTHLTMSRSRGTTAERAALNGVGGRA